MEEIDPFAGLVLAYNVSSVCWDGPRGHRFSEPSSGGLWLAATAGARYWLTPTVALVGRLGFGSLSSRTGDSNLPDLAFWCILRS